MKGFRAVDFLAPLGFLVIVGAEGWQRWGKTLPGKPEYYLIAGAALILTHLLLRFEDITRRVGRRQMKYGANTTVLVAVVLASLGFVNYLVFRHTKRWDLTKGQRLQIGEAILEVTGPCDPCSRMDEIRMGLQQELLGQRGTLCRVVEGGRIQRGDTIELAAATGAGGTCSPRRT